MASQVYVCQLKEESSSSIKEYIQTCENTENKSIQFLSPQSSTDEPAASQAHPTLAEYVTSLCRRHGALPRSRVTLLSMEDSLQALQLSLAHRNKEKGNEFEAEAGKVMDYHQKIVNSKLNPDDLPSSQTCIEVAEIYKDFLASCGHIDLGDVVSAFVKEMEKDVGDSELQRDLGDTVIVLLGVPTSQVERALMKHVCIDSKVTELVSESLSDESSTFVPHQRTLTELLPLVEETPTKSKNQSVLPIQQLFSTRVLLSYLHILVNGRSELALAKIFNVPDRELDGHAFTALKHEAKKKKMSMFLTATSFLMRIRLGGKGYAPDESPIFPFTKGIGELVDLVQHLQTVAEEELNTRAACRKVLNIVKNRLIKCPRLKLRREEVEKATADLQQNVLDIINELEVKAIKSPEKPASEGGSLIGRRTLHVIRLLLDKMACSHGDNDGQFFLSDISLNPATPTRVPCMLSQFKSPELVSVDDTSDEKPGKTSGLADRTNTRNWEKAEVVLPCGEKMTRKQLNSVIVFPSKTVAHPAPETAKLMLGLNPDKKIVSCAAKDKENIRAKPSLKSDQPTKRRKLATKENKTVQSEVQVEKSLPFSQSSLSQPSQSDAKDKKKSKGARRRLLPQVKGQQKLSGFFRV